ncbi:glycoside hydrolase family 3 N-terminal domain-containing protein [Glutamicibacter endophyticus]|uniref:glycoside hydrolase family 3 N-terminal domain-containing protein n=1 Tax=Glutamicibacter endophyticus TaxID=1522174 RepID=UPI003AF10B4B
MKSPLLKLVSPLLVGSLLLVATGCGPSEGPQATTPTGSSGAPQSPTAPSSTDPTSAEPSRSATSPEPTAPVPSTEPSTEAQRAARLAAQMSSREQAGQLVVAGVEATGATKATLKSLSKAGVANVFLRGRSKLSVKQTAAVTGQLRSALSANSPEGLDAWVATDQEGGYVRVLQGSGFSDLPTAVTQAKWSTQRLDSTWRSVAKELQKAGVNVNLAPVADVVDPALGRANAPIGYFSRNYGSSLESVTESIRTVNQALSGQGVQPVVKHFPGLGNVRGNTDTTASVTDTATSGDSESLRPFVHAIEQGQAWVMVANARYTRIDKKNDAPFSRALIQGLLREKLGYDGVVISDDLCEAKQVASVPVGERAVRFIDAGGTLPLCVDAEKSRTMINALVKQADTDEQFAQRLEDAVTVALTAKLEKGKE